MTKFVYKDKNGKLHFEEISDRKKCLSSEEVLNVINSTPLKNHVYDTGRTHYNGNTYHVIHFNYWAGFTLVLSFINSRYGRGIETILNQEEYPSCQLLIRAYKK